MADPQVVIIIPKIMIWIIGSIYSLGLFCDVLIRILDWRLKRQK